MCEKNNGGNPSKFFSEGKDDEVQNVSIQSQNIDPVQNEVNRTFNVQDQVQNESTKSQNVDNQTVDKANPSQSGTTQTPDASFLTRIHQALTTAWSRMKRLFCCAKCSTSSASSNNSSVSTSSLYLPELKVRYEQL